MRHGLKLCHARSLSSPCFCVCFCNVLLHLIIALIIHVLLSKEISNIHYHKISAQKEISTSVQTRPLDISYLHQLHKTRWWLFIIKLWLQLLQRFRSIKNYCKDWKTVKTRDLHPWSTQKHLMWISTMIAQLKLPCTFRINVHQQY